ncbi:MAG: GtrA family protein [Gammaproteobacteria bacterium]
MTPSTLLSNTFVRYGIAGGIAAGLLFCMLVILVEYYALNATLSSAIAFILASALNYSLQYYWTFRSSNSHLTAFTRYISFALLMLGVNTFVFWALQDRMGVYYLIAQMVSTFLVFILNYSLNRRYTF